MRAFRHSLMLCLAAGSISFVATRAQAQTVAAAHRYDIPAMPLGKALNQFAEMSGLQVMFAPQAVAGLRSPGLSGSFTPERALEQLLAPAGLSFSHSKSGVYLIAAPARTVALRPVAFVPAQAAADSAQAQDDAPVQTHTEPAAPAQPDRDIIVTGSRVITNGNKSPTPLTVVSAQQLLTANPAGIVEGLNTLPGLLGSTNNTTNITQAGYNLLNLRGVGPLRGLILLDGHRIGSTQNSGETDVDVIPQVLLQRVDVVTGGASAVYGSDAVSGVVNFVTDTKFNGLKVDASGGFSNYGDDEKYKISAAWGHKIGDNGHFEIGYEYNNSLGFYRSQRPFFNTNYTEQGSVAGSSASPGTAANPYQLTRDARISTASFGGLVNSGPLAGLNFTNPGQLTPFVNGAATGTSGVQTGGQGAYYTGSTAGVPERTHKVFSRFDYDVTPGIHFYAEGAFTYLTVDAVKQNLLLSKVAVGYSNPYLQSLQPQYLAVVNAQAAANPLSSFTFSKMNQDIADFNNVGTEHYYMATAGFKGALSNFDWDVSYTHTDSRQMQTITNNINEGKFYASLNAVKNPANGQTVCNAALVNPATYGGCVPINLFGNGQVSQSAINYFTQATSADYRWTGDDLAGSISGDAFTLPAGPVKTALSGELRRIGYSVNSNATPTDPVNCTGIQFNCTATTSPYFSGAVANLPMVHENVGEVALETDIPVLADKPFFKALNVNAAGRYTNYSVSGGVTTWKGGLVWQVSSDLTLRGTRSRDIRAPNLYDLYQPASTTLKNYTDQLTNTSGLVNEVSQGNSHLQPEKADTITLGGVLTPHILPGFSFSVDYYNINIKNAIVTVDSFQASTQAACIASGGTASVCALYVRPFPITNTTAANYPTLLLSESANVAAVKTHGIDFEMNYNHRFGSDALHLRGLLNYQPHLIYNNGPSGIVDVAGSSSGIAGLTATPKVKIVATASYDFGEHFSLLVQERWRAKLTQNGAAGIYFNDPDVPSIGYTSVNLTAKVNAHLEAYFNVQNLFNSYPPAWASTSSSVQPNYVGGFDQGDDIEGRFMTFGVRIRM